MNLRELIVLTNDLVRKNGSYRGELETQDTVVMLNHALKFIGRKLNIYDPAVRFTMTDNVGVYKLDSDAFGKIVTKIDKVIIGGKQLSNSGGSRSGVWSINELDRRYPDWRTNTTKGTPAIAADYGSNKLLVYNLPNSSTAALTTHFVSGWVIPGVYSANGTYAKGFGLVDKAELPAGYDQPMNGGPQPQFNGAGGGMGGTIIPPGVTVAPPVSGGTTGTGFTGGSGSGGGGPRLEEAEDVWDLPDGEGGIEEPPGGFAVPTGTAQGGPSELVWDLWAEPDIVEDLHPLLCYWSSLKLAEPTASDEMTFAKLAQMRGDLVSLIKEVAAGYDSRQMPWGDSAGGGSQFNWRVRF